MSPRKILVLSLLAAASLVNAQPASAPARAAPAAAPMAAAAAPAASAESGKIAYYGRKFAGRKTASGERFNPNAMTMAHKSLPFGTLVKVSNPKNGKSVTLRVNDRGPSTPDRVADVSASAARKLGMLRAGVIAAELQVVGQAAPARASKAGKSGKA
jgi:rare lipoprotein A